MDSKTLMISKYTMCAFYFLNTSSLNPFIDKYSKVRVRHVLKVENLVFTIYNDHS